MHPAVPSWNSSLSEPPSTTLLLTTGRAEATPPATGTGAAAVRGRARGKAASHEMGRDCRKGIRERGEKYGEESRHRKMPEQLHMGDGQRLSRPQF